MNPKLISFLPDKFQGLNVLEDYLSACEDILDIILRKLENLPRLVNPSVYGLTTDETNMLEQSNYDEDGLPIENILRLARLINYAPWYWYAHITSKQLRNNVRQAVFWYQMVCRSACYEVIGKLVDINLGVEELWTWDYEHFFPTPDDWCTAQEMFDRGDFDDYNTLYPESYDEFGNPVFWTEPPYKSPHFNLILYLDEEINHRLDRLGLIDEVPEGVGRLQDDLDWWTAYMQSVENVRPAHTVIHYLGLIYCLCNEDLEEISGAVSGESGEYEPVCIEMSQVCTVPTDEWEVLSNLMDMGYCMDDGYYMDEPFAGKFALIDHFKIGTGHAGEAPDPSWSDLGNSVYEADISEKAVYEDKFTVICEVPETEVFADLTEVALFTEAPFNEMLVVATHPYYTKRGDHVLRYQFDILRST